MNNPIKKKPTQSPQEAELRQEAKERLQKQPPSDRAAPQTPAQLLHDLRVHQAELEMQNEELRLVQAELETSRSNYIDLFELAPVGYLVLNENGIILEANLTAAGLLGVARSALVKKLLTHFILPEDQDIYYHHRKQLFESGASQGCELRMLPDGAEPLWVRLEASAAQDADGALLCRTVMSDISDRMQAENALKAAETRFRELFNNIKSGVAVYEVVGDGTDFIFKDFNNCPFAEIVLTFFNFRLTECRRQLINQATPGYGFVEQSMV